MGLYIFACLSLISNFVTRWILPNVEPWLCTRERHLIRAASMVWAVFIHKTKHSARINIIDIVLYFLHLYYVASSPSFYKCGQINFLQQIFIAWRCETRDHVDCSCLHRFHKFNICICSCTPWLYCVFQVWTNIHLVESNPCKFVSICEL